METISRLKWSLVIFSVIFSVSFGCETNYNGCYQDVVCANEDNVLLDLYKKNHIEDCRSEHILINVYGYTPIRIKFKSAIHFDSLFYFNLNHYNNMRTLVVSLEVSDSSLSNTPDISRMPNLKMLNLSNNVLMRAKLFSQVNLRALQNVDLSHNHINSIEVGQSGQLNMYVFKELRMLNLSHNWLTDIIGGVFVQFQHLEYLDLSYNNIVHIDNKTFEGLQKTKYLSLSHNNINDVKDSFLEFSDLEELHLNNNNITKISEQNFETLRKLRTLCLEFNNISFVQPGTFKYNIFLNNLNLSHNALISLNNGAFRGLVGLTTLDVSYNIIQDLRQGKFNDTPNLKILIADHNRITDVSNVFLGIQLDTLSIGHNPLSCDKITSLKQNGQFNITAINIDYINENIDGIVCSMPKYKNMPEVGIHETKITSNPDANNTYLFQELLNKLDKVGIEQTEKIMNLKSKDSDELIKTNILLEKILKVVSGFGPLKIKFAEVSLNNNEISNKDKSYVLYV